MAGFGGWPARRAALILAIALAVGYGIQQFPVPAPATTSAPVPVPVSPGSAALTRPAQSALDQVLGPHRAVVTASARYGNASTRVSTSYDPKHVAALSRSTVSGSGYQAGVTDNGVSQSVTVSQVPAGQLQGLAVSVVIDAGLRPAPNLAAIRKIVTASMGLQPARGDRLAVVAMPFAAGTFAAGTVAAATVGSPAGGAVGVTGSLTRIIPYVPTLAGVALAAVLAVVLLTGTLRQRQRQRQRQRRGGPASRR